MRNKKIYIIISIMLILLLLATSGFLSYSIFLFKGLETFYRIAGIVIIGYIMLLLIYLINKNCRLNRKKRFIAVSIISFIFSACFGIGGYIIYTVYGSIDNFSKDTITYTSYLISFDSKYKDSEIKDAKIGIVDDEEDIELYQIPKEIIEEKDLENGNNLVKYNSVIDLIKAIYDKEVDLAFVNGNYDELFLSFEEYSNIGEKATQIATKSREVEKMEIESEITDTSSLKNLTEPFTILLLGVDSAADGLNKNAAFNGDTLMLVTFNPKTLNATMFSIPRDTYVKIMCGNRQVQKINTSAYGGTSCVMKTIKELTGITIDYYAKINFKGVVSLVDALGGIDVKVPYSFCEQNSSRKWGSSTVFVYEGNQTLNGEQALALARNRHSPKDSANMRKYCTNLRGGVRNDFVRGQNQQSVVEGMLNKVKTIKSGSTFMELLDIVSKNVDTNLSTDQILSFYEVIKTILSAKSIDVVNIQKTLLKGYDMRVYETSAKAERYAFFHWKGSLDDIVEAMEVNLGKKSSTVVKKFSFDANTTYEKAIIGKSSYNEKKVQLVPNFSTYTYSKAKSWGTSNGMTINILDYDTKEILSSISGYTFFSQSVHEKVLVMKAGKTIDLYYKKKVVEPVEPVEQSEEVSSNSNEEASE